MNKATRVSIAEQAYIEIEPDYLDAMLWVEIDGYLVTFSGDLKSLEAAGADVDWSIEDSSPFVMLSKAEAKTFRLFDALIRAGHKLAIVAQKDGE
jgi:hypothetical protein